MNLRPDISAEKLHAFIDGELDQAESESIAQQVAADRALAEQVAGFRADKAALSKLFGPLVERPVPEAWIASIEQGARSRARSNLPLWAALAAALVLVAVSFVYFRPLPAGGEDAIIREAIAARSHALASRNAIAASAGQQGEIDRTMTASLKMPLKAPDLSRMGYRLTGMRVYDNVPGGKAVELIYRGAGNRDVAIYVRKPSSAVRFDQFRREGLRVCVWQDDVLGTVITGKMSAAEMQRIASLAYTGLES